MYLALVSGRAWAWALEDSMELAAKEVVSNLGSSKVAIKLFETPETELWEQGNIDVVGNGQLLWRRGHRPKAVGVFTYNKRHLKPVEAGDFGENASGQQWAEQFNSREA